MEKLNKVLELAIPEINAGRLPDVRKLALKVGVEDEEAISFLEKAVADTMRKMREQ